MNCRRSTSARTLATSNCRHSAPHASIHSMQILGMVGHRPARSMLRALAPRTIGHIHRLVVQILAMAERDGLIPSNPARKAKRPKVERTEIEILGQEQVKDVLRKLQGHRRMYRLAAIGLGTGLRRGELCALRWSDVDLEVGSLRVEQSLEQTKREAGAYAKFDCGSKAQNQNQPAHHRPSRLHSARTARPAPRPERGAPAPRSWQEADDALVFRKPDGSPLLPNSVTTEWRRLSEATGASKGVTYTPGDTPTPAN